MAKINPEFQHLKRAYIFPIIEKKLETLKESYPQAPILNLGIGDVAKPLAPAVVEAICTATHEMGTEEGRRGYPPSCGYPFLKEAIARTEYAPQGISPEEIFISDGAGSDVANIQEIFSHRSQIAITDPTYPVYLDTNILAGRKARIHLLPCKEECHFSPSFPDVRCDLIYLCTPNNPTGVAMTRQELQAWVDYAKQHESLLLIDNAYAAFVTSPDVPKTIFELEGAKEVAIECRSFSKSAGFTGLRCAYTVLPKSVRARLGRKKISVHTYWDKRQSIKFNGVAYPIQRGAEAALSPDGKRQTGAQVRAYLQAATYLRTGLQQLGHTCYGGVDSPYLFWRTPAHLKSWDFFDLLLDKCHLISIPGSGFGTHGEGFVRLSAFTTIEHASEALERIKRL